MKHSSAGWRIWDSLQVFDLQSHMLFIPLQIPASFPGFPARGWHPVRVM
jgi:hypothetical protein